MFYQPLSSPGGKTKPSEPKYRARTGRCGRVFLDRKGLSPMSPKTTTTSDSGHPVFDRYRFDSDVSDNEDDSVVVDEMDSLYFKHRVQLLSENELRSLVTIPFLTPLNMININQARSAAAAVSASSNNSSTSRTPATPSRIHQQAQQQSPLPPSPVSSVVSQSSAGVPIKRQNSRTKMTPQQAAVAMANGMIAANMAAVVNGTSNSNKAAIQIMAAAHQQQQLNHGKRK